MKILLAIPSQYFVVKDMVRLHELPSSKEAME